MTSSSSYGSHAYWEHRYSTGTDVKAEFEWFLSYSDCSSILKTALDFSDETAVALDLGCGTSFFLRDLKKDGYQGKCVGLDYSEVAVKAMNKRRDCKTCEFVRGDATRLKKALLEGNVKVPIDVVLDKSLMDTLLHNDEDMLVEVLRGVAEVVKDCGVWVCITQLDPRKEKDQEFLARVVLPALCNDRVGIESLQAHVTKVEEGDDAPLPVPTILIARFKPKHVTKKRRGASAGNGNVEIEIIEYADDDDSEDSENSDS